MGCVSEYTGLLSYLSFTDNLAFIHIYFHSFMCVFQFPIVFFYLLTDCFHPISRRDSYDSLSSDPSDKSDSDEQWLSQVGPHCAL